MDSRLPDVGLVRQQSNLRVGVSSAAKVSGLQILSVNQFYVQDAGNGIVKQLHVDYSLALLGHGRRTGFRGISLCGVWSKWVVLEDEVDYS